MSENTLSTGKPADPPKTPAERLFPEAQTAKLAMDVAFTGNADKLRDKLGLTEAQTAQLKTVQTELFTGIIPPHEMASVHDALTTALVHRPITPTQQQKDDDLKQAEAARMETMTAGRVEHTWAWDRVLARAREIVAAKPRLMETFRMAGLEHDKRVWLPIFRQARAQLKREGKL